MWNFIKSIFRVIDKVLFLIVLSIIMVFCFNNHQLVTISLSPLPLELETRLFLVVLLCFFGGIFFASVYSSFSLSKEKLRSWTNNCKIEFLKKKIDKIENKNKD